MGLLLVIAGCDGGSPAATPTAIPGAGGTGGAGGAGEPAAGTLGADLQALITGPLTAIDSAMLLNDVTAARTAFTELDETWAGLEAAVQAASPEVFTRIDAAKDKLEAELVTAETPNVVGVSKAVADLRAALRDFITTAGSSGG
jgi:hypothetical protein